MMTTNIDQQIDEIFGAPKKLEVCTQALELLAAALAPMDPEALWFVDVDGRTIADWSRHGGADDEDLCDPPSAEQPHGISRSAPESDWLLHVSLGTSALRQGTLLGRLDASRSLPELETLLAERLELIRRAGDVFLELMAGSARISDAEARLRQLTRQQETFQEEHRRIVAMNLFERNARLAEQRTYTARLQEEVRERTRQLVERSEALEESEARNRAIVDTAPDGIIMIDDQGRIESFNPAAEKMFGYKAEEVLARNVSLIMPAPFSNAHDGFMEQYRKTEQRLSNGLDREVTGHRKDGTEFPLELTIGVVAQGGQRRFTGIVRDVTGRKQAEKSLREYAHALEEGTNALENATIQSEAANRSKSEFLANMSHEIRTPMTAIVGHAELLREPDQTPEERANSAEVIQRNADHLLQLINDILDLSKIESGKLSVEKIACSPCQVIAEVASMMRTRAHDKGLYFHVEYPGLVPETIESDPTRFRQILVNLVGNAIKFTQTGGIRVSCSLIDPPEAAHPRLRIAVIDTGIGIAAERLGRLFDPFVQADSSTTRHFGGTGLGLAISRRLANALGGDIDVESEPGRGSSFALTLGTGALAGAKLLDRPREAELRDALRKKTPSPSQLDIPSLDGRRILLAEDGWDNQDLISHHFRKAGAAVEIAENGKVAFEKAMAAAQSDRPYDVIFMDMQMPVMDGYTATSELRANGYTHPIVALTAHAMVGDRDKCLDAGCDDYLTKPINRYSLLRLAAQHCAAGAEPKSTTAEQPLPGVQNEDDTAPLTSHYADDPDMAEILEVFLARLDETAASLRAAADASDLERLGQVAHQLKGSAGGYGFPAITEKAAEVERLAERQDEGASLRQALEELLTLCRRARASSAGTHKVQNIEVIA